MRRISGGELRDRANEGRMVPLALYLEDDHSLRPQPLGEPLGAPVAADIEELQREEFRTNGRDALEHRRPRWFETPYATGHREVGAV